MVKFVRVSAQEWKERQTGFGEYKNIKGIKLKDDTLIFIAEDTLK